MTPELRGDNLTLLAEGGRIDLLWQIVYTLRRLEDRGITQSELARELGRSVMFVKRALGVYKLTDMNVVERNLEMIDDAITRISDREGRPW